MFCTKGVSKWCSKVSALGVSPVNILSMKLCLVTHFVHEIVPQLSRLRTDAPAPLLGADISVSVSHTPNMNFLWAFTKPLVALEGSGTFSKWHSKASREWSNGAQPGIVEWRTVFELQTQIKTPHISKAFGDNWYFLRFSYPSPSLRAAPVDFHGIHLNFKRRS